MDYVEIIFVLGALLFFGSDLLMMALAVKDLKDGKAKASWRSMGVVRRGLVVGLIVGWSCSSTGWPPTAYWPLDVISASSRP